MPMEEIFGLVLSRETVRFGSIDWKTTFELLVKCQIIVKIFVSSHDGREIIPATEKHMFSIVPGDMVKVYLYNEGDVGHPLVKLLDRVSSSPLTHSSDAKVEPRKPSSYSGNDLLGDRGGCSL